jgi:hypothetical protein
VIVIRVDGGVPPRVADSLRDPIERGAAGYPGYCEAYIYGLGGPVDQELMVRFSTAHGVVPVLMRTRDFDPARVAATVKTVLARPDL